jgi:predicted molibdopterin-dependent oxidoreductase YjgC
MKEVTFSIDGLKVKANEGDTILQAALKHDIYIPHLCYHPDLKPFGGCRLCVVEIEGRGLTISCKAPVEEGVSVITENPAVTNIRRVAAELIIANHYTDCLQCARNADCRLQDIAAYIGIEEGRLERLKQTVRTLPIDDSNPFFRRDPNKCVLCGICVRTCEEINGVCAIDFAFRGFATKVSTLKDKPIKESTCESCGECVVRCPTAALAPKVSERPAREVKTICPYCGTGCGIYLGVRGDRVISARGDPDSVVNKGQLCVKGRFGYGFVNHPDRLTTPLIKRNGTFVEASWDEALDLVAAKFKEAQDKYGPEALGGIASARVTNEDNYLFMKLLRSLGTNSVDCCARLCHAPTVVGLSTITGSGAMTNPIGDIPEAGAILVTGHNTTETHPVIGYRIREAVRRGAKLVVADPRRIPLVNIADVHLQFKPGMDVALYNALAHVIIREGLEDKEFIKERTIGFEYLKEFLQEYTPEYVSKITGVPAEDIVRAARLYAQAKSAAIIYCMGVTQHTSGAENVFALTNLCMLTGNFGKPHAGMNPIRGQNSVQGVCDMGCLPNVLTGYQPVYGDRAWDTFWRRLGTERAMPTTLANPAPEKIDTSVVLADTIEFERPVYQGMSVSDEIRAKFAKVWGVEPPDIPGRTIAEMFHPNPTRRSRVMYIMGENPVVSSPNANLVRKCLEEMDFVVVQDIFLTETAQYADVVLPAASFAEKDGTFINTERRVQRVRRVINPPGNAKPDWEIIQLLAQRFNLNWNYTSPKEIWDEVRKLTAHYFGGMSYERLGKGGLQWPCPKEDHPGTSIMHRRSWRGEENRFARGIGLFSTVDYRPWAAEPADEEYPFILTTGRKLYHYHTSTMTNKTDGLNYLLSKELMEINPVDAQKLELTADDRVRVTSRRGSVESSIQITDRVPPGVVCMSFHFADTPTNVLANPAVCNMSVDSGLKVAAVRIEKA